MYSFSIENIKYNYIWHKPNKKAKYGLALSYWYSNIEDLIFFVKYVNSWLGREFIDISICSYAKLTDEQQQILINVGVNYIIDCLEDRGHQDGTTAHCNGAIYPLYQNKQLKTIIHTDADVIFLNASYFFYFSNLVLDSDKHLLTSNVSYGYSVDNIEILNRVNLGVESDANQQFGSMFALNCVKFKKDKRSYFPFKLKGHFEFDRATQFFENGYSLDDVILFKRIVNGEENTSYSHSLLEGMNFHLGLSHSTNTNTNFKNNILILNQHDKL